ncbi:MAG: YfhO family protein, partial [Oscillospiraceae bacterium]|nr:YfhO family protein [Oscillospiraceae bacterium]
SRGLGDVYNQTGIAVAFLVLLWLLINVRKNISPALFMRRVTSVTILCSLVLGYYFLGYGRIINGNGATYQRMVNAEFEIDDPEFYRIEGLNETNNVNMLWGMSSLKSFTSIIPGSTFELYDLLGITRTVNSAPENNRYAFRALARVKYIMIPKSMRQSTRESALSDLMIYEYMETQGEYDIYKTDYALPMGFSYDTYLAVDDVKSNKRVDNLLVRAAVLTDEQIEKYSDILEPEDVTLTGVINILRFKMDAAKRIAGGVSDFAVNNSGFTASSNYESEKLVVFSVPYCKGWSATVNGNAVEVDKINGGLCGIRVPAGEASIVFTYETPGLKYGIYASVIGIVLLGAYMLILYVVLHKRPTPYVHLYDIDQHDGVLAHRSYVRQISEQIYGASELGGRPPEQLRMMDLPKLKEELSEEDRNEFPISAEDDEKER